jgi:hypothetical protein
MDWIFDNLIFVVFIAIGIIVQIGRFRKKQADRRNRNGNEEEEAREAINSMYEDEAEEDEGAFSAWDLPVSAGAEPPVPVRAPVLIVERTEPVSKPPPVFLSRAGRAAPVCKHKFPENLNYLPPLKRAVVLTEILGTPKGY